MSTNTDKMFDAISIVADSIVKKYQYDKTIEAKIVSIAQKDQGIYKVEYENAIFDAYSSDTQSFYENETVYVSVPQGDFSKQKHIIGRKVDLEKAPDRTFNFKMPFDNFVGLKDLTKESPYTYGKKGYLANNPEHGGHSVTYSEYQNTVAEHKTDLDNVEAVHSAQIQIINNEEQASLNLINSSFSTIGPGKVIGNVPYKNNEYNTYLDKMCACLEAYELNNLSAVITEYKNYVKPTDQTETNAMIAASAMGYEDQQALLDSIQTYINRCKASEEESYTLNKTIELDAMQAALAEYNGSSYNHIWSWDNENHEILLESTLGISIDVETLLGEYFPRSGSYGLRIEITGTAKPNEQDAARTVTEEIIWTNQQMYGNTYAFYVPYGQQKILDVSSYISIEHIDIFFYQDHHFIDYRGNAIAYQTYNDDGTTSLLPSNIYLDNLKVLLGITIDEINTDKVLLYTYDPLTYGESILDPQVAEKNEKEIILAWIHKVDGGAIIVDQNLTEQVTPAQQPKTLEYYDAHIYWYHYLYNVPQDASDIKQQYGGLNWEYLSDFDDQFSIRIQPDYSLPRERYKAVVVFGGVPYYAEPIEFTNGDTTVVVDTYNQNNEVVFRILREQLDGQGNFVIAEDNNLSNFFVYDENNLCIKNEDNVRWSDIWYYIQVWIKNYETDSYVPLPLLVDDVNWDNNSFTIEWQYPITETMLEFSPVDASDLQNSALTPLNGNISEALQQAIINCTKKFRIRDRWDMRYINNTVAAIVNRGSRVYKPQKEFLFGQSGSMGSKYTVRIIQDEPEAPCMIQDEHFRVRAVVFDEKMREVTDRNMVFSWKLLSPTIITKGKLDPIEGNWKEEFAKINADDSGNNNIKNVIQGYIRNAYPPVFEVTVRSAADYPIKTIEGFKLIDNSEINTNYRINVPNKVEFKSDGKAPVTINSNFEVYKLVNGGAEQQIHPDWEIHQWKLSGENWEEQLTDDIPAKPDVKYIGLKSTIIADTEIATNNNPVVYYKTGDLDAGFALESTGELITAATYRDIKLAITTEYENAIAADTGENAEHTAEYVQQYNNRIYRLNLAVNKVIPTYNVYALNPYVDYSPDKAIPWQWEDGLGENYYTVIEFSNGGIYFKQAIPFTRNVYSSSLMNTWNGSISIDDTNNSVLAQMISAGAKDQNNRFTGVMMGDWANYADNSLDTPGLYGFKYGDQVFGFKTDGTGFIGKPGKGRIEFDGNKSLISNSDRSCYINLDPVVYNADGWLDNYNGYSSYFMYVKVPKTSQASIIGEDTLDQSTFWTTDFMEDEENDYFIVDPNNGVLTTGGVIARYGKIGNWMISKAGLYQRITDNEYPANNRYMYLGYPEDVDNLNVGILSNELEARKQRDKDTLWAEYLAKNADDLFKYYKQIFQFDPMHYYNYGWPCKRAIDIIDKVFENYEEISQELYDNTFVFKYGFTKYELETLGLTRENQIVLAAIFKYTNEVITADDIYRHLHAHFREKSDGTIDSETIYPNQETGGIPYQFIKIFTGFFECQYGKYYSRTYLENGVTVNQLNKYRSSIPDDYGNYNKWNYEDCPPETYFIMAADFHPGNPVLILHNDNYYGTIDPSKQWHSYAVDKGISTECYGISLNTTSLTLSYLGTVKEWLEYYYAYILDGYTRQLSEGIAAGIATLSLEDQTEYEALSWQNNQEYQQALLELEKEYDVYYNKLKNRANRIIESNLHNDANKYMIFAGYTPTDKPLFSVNWRGYMTAREGRIGDTSPWYIGDRGLTQKNNSGTIFLGDPETTPGNLPQDAQGQSYTSIDNNGHYWIIDGPNGGKVPLLNNNTWDGTGTAPVDRGPAMFWWDFTNKQSPAYSIDYGNFAIYAGDTGIRFGVRMDGSFLSTKGNIGGWSIDRTYLATIPSNLGYQEYGIGEDNAALNPKNMIVLDAGNHQMLFGGPTADTAATVIYGNGAIKLSAHTDGLGQDGMNVGTLDLGGYWLQGITAVNDTNVAVGFIEVPIVKEKIVAKGFTYEFAYDISENTIHTFADFEYTPETATARIKSYDFVTKPNMLSIIDSTLNNGNLGIKIITGTVTYNPEENEEEETVEEEDETILGGPAVVVYPVGANISEQVNNEFSNKRNRATLGTITNPWNLVASSIQAANISSNSIYCQDIYVAGDTLATHSWVWHWIEELAKRIKDVAGSAGSAFSGVGHMAANLSAQLELLNNLTFVAGYGSIESSEDCLKKVGYSHQAEIPLLHFTWNKGDLLARDAKGVQAKAGKLYIKGIDGSNLYINTAGFGDVFSASYKVGPALNAVLAKVIIPDEYTAPDSSNGLIKIDMDTYGGGKVTINFNMANTTFYKYNVFRKIETSGSNGVKTALSKQRLDNKTITGTIEYTSIETASAWARSKLYIYSDTETLADIDVIVHSDVAYRAGWNAAMDSLQWDGGEPGGASTTIGIKGGTGAVSGCKQPNIGTKTFTAKLTEQTTTTIRCSASVSCVDANGMLHTDHDSDSDSVSYYTAAIIE